MLQLLTPVGARWTIADDVPTILTNSQVAMAGLLGEPSYRELGADAVDFQQDHDADPVLTLEHSQAGWQITRNGGLPVVIRRSFTECPIILAVEGAVAILCHKDQISFGGDALLEVQLPPAVSGIRNHADSESDDCAGQDELEEEFLPEFQRLSQSSSQTDQSEKDTVDGEADLDFASSGTTPIGPSRNSFAASTWSCTRCRSSNPGFHRECEMCGKEATARSSWPVSVLSSPHCESSPSKLTDSLPVSPPEGSQHDRPCISSTSSELSVPSVVSSTAETRDEVDESALKSSEDPRAKYFRDRQLALAHRQLRDQQRREASEREKELNSTSAAQLEEAKRQEQADLQLAQQLQRQLQETPIHREHQQDASQSDKDQAEHVQSQQNMTHKQFLTWMTAKASAPQKQNQHKPSQPQPQLLGPLTGPISPQQQKNRRKTAKRAKLEINSQDTRSLSVSITGSRQVIPPRRQAASNFKLGLDPLPPITLGMEQVVPSRVLSVGTLQVLWPAAIKPTRPQLLLMRHAAAALTAERHALLESPTGTGKTLALLATVLATQWARKETASALGHPYHQRMIYVSRTHAQLDQVTRELKRLPYRPMMSLLASRERFCLHADVSRADDKAAACADATHIGQGCCTHLDRAESIGYPQRSNYLKAFKAGGNMAVYDIEEIVKDNTARHVCPFHATRDLMTGEGSETEGWAAGLILITYTQLINVCVREASGTERLIDDSLIVVDEAHNLDSDCRDTASLELCPLALASHLEKLAEFKVELEKGVEARGENPVVQRWMPGGQGRGNGATMDLTECVKSADKLIEFFARTQRWLESWSAGRPPSARQEFSGRALAAGIEEAVAKPSEVATLREKLRKMRQGLVELGVESEAVKSTAINESDNQLMRFEFLLRDQGVHYTAFYCVSDSGDSASTKGKHSRNSELQSGKGKRGGLNKGKGGGRGGVSGSNRCFYCGGADHRAMHCPHRTRSTAPARLHLLCWSASVAFEPITKRCSSILLTSGTLQPMGLLQSEFFADGPLQSVPTSPKPPQAGKKLKERKPWEPLDRSPEQITARRTFLQFSAPHFEAVSGNLLNLFVSAAPTANGTEVQMLGDYKQRSQPSYIEAVGGTILGVARQVPHGLLVYFASTGALTTAVEHWNATGLMAALGTAKEIFIEPMRATADDFDRVLSDYKAAAMAPRGAVLLAVLRGRASEGLNFSHDHARGVVMVSIAYPPIYDIKVQSKRNRPKGADWYTGQAFKAANQAIGRLIRNTEDYGVLVLLDRRYATKTLRQLLPGWVRKAHRQWHVRIADELAPGFEAIGQFFQEKITERDAGVEMLD